MIVVPLWETGLGSWGGRIWEITYHFFAMGFHFSRYSLNFFIIVFSLFTENNKFDKGVGNAFGTIVDGEWCVVGKTTGRILQIIFFVIIFTGIRVHYNKSFIFGEIDLFLLGIPHKLHLSEIVMDVVDMVVGTAPQAVKGKKVLIISIVEKNQLMIICAMKFCVSFKKMPL